jgi:single-stranded-DNA-specific exonuclease
MSAEPISIVSDAAFGVARSLTGRRWRLFVSDGEIVRSLAQSADISITQARLLAARGITADAARTYLRPTLKHLLPEPMTLKDMELAVVRARTAIETGEKIAIFGDYDVDGSASTAILYGFLSAVGSQPRIYIPDRLTEGYGPNWTALAKLKAEGISLVITVDCGAGAVEALTAARDSGLDVVVLDHHAVETAPPSVAHVNPNQPGDTSNLGQVCAAGVTFLFVVALNRTLRDSGWYESKKITTPDLLKYIDLVGLATVCDVVPLVGINRAFVRTGLSRIAKLDRPGLAALAEVAGISPPFTSQHLGFAFGPRINAGGRVGRGGLGVDLLITDDRERVREYATSLDTHNRERQAIEKVILDEAIEMSKSQANAPLIFVSSEGWHAGVVGIVASRLKDRFGKPSFVAGFEGGIGRGSARSIAGFDIGAAVRAAREQKLLDSGGGHAMAAGFTLRPGRVSPFHEFLVERFARSDASLAPREVTIDVVVSPAGATAALVDEFAQAGPFGAGNAEPIVVVPDVQVRFVDVVGNSHIRLRLEGSDGAALDAIAFRSLGSELGGGLLSARGRSIHAVGRLRADLWNGRRRVQLELEDAALRVD